MITSRTTATPRSAGIISRLKNSIWLIFLREKNTVPVEKTS
jgi:hypothetical protein